MYSRTNFIILNKTAKTITKSKGRQKFTKKIIVIVTGLRKVEEVVLKGTSTHWKQWVRRADQLSAYVYNKCNLS